MLKGIVLALSACFIWGLIFVIPSFVEGFSSLEIALGRYFFYGIISIVFLGGFCFRKLMQYPLKIWLRALWFALIANIVYYTSLVLAVQYSNAGIAALIVGIAPISISFYGNLKQNECNFSKLIFPALLTALGLFIVNIEVLFGSEATSFSYEYLLGLMGAFIALGAWTWYVVANIQFLKANPSMTHFEWSTMLGVTTFVWVIIGALLLGLFVMDAAALRKYFILTYELKMFLVGTAILGCVCSWIGSYLWNSGCTLLPVSFGGQLTIFETVFGLLFIYLIEKRLPSYLECIGISFMFLAIIYSMNMFAKMKRQPLHV